MYCLINRKCQRHFILSWSCSSSSSSFYPLLFRQNHPGTIVYNTDRFSGWSSLENIWHQVEEMGDDLLAICNRHPEGVHLLGYSQGGLIARSIIETMDDLNVKNFISLSSPQAGQFGSRFSSRKFPEINWTNWSNLKLQPNFCIWFFHTWLQKPHTLYFIHMLVNIRQWEITGTIHINKSYIEISAHFYHS